MNAAVASSNWQTLENVDVECTHCGVRMTLHDGSGRRVRYFRCGSCHRWVSSVYTDVLRSDSKMRTHPAKDTSAADERFMVTKNNLERWLSALEDSCPYRALGVSPSASHEVIRARFRELALERHPDRGGSVEQMRELNDAYERILRHRERQAAEASASRVAPVRAVSSLPARSR